ncbi:MAG: ABC transporter permease [Clostridiales bacterium]|nr:ABC transporter permease [Clostridiales bacterium]
MQAFKLFMKILKSQLGIVIMYVSIFVILTFVIIIPSLSNNKSQDFVNNKCKIAYFDYDNSTASKSVIDYLCKINKEVKLKNDSEECIQDELFNRTVHAVIVFREGFGRDFEAGCVGDKVEINVIKNTNVASLVENEYSSYITKAGIYRDNGYGVKGAFERASIVSDTKIEVAMTGKSDNKQSPMTIYFNYLGWILIISIISAVSPVLIAMNKTQVKERVYCSSYKFSSYNAEIIISLIVVGIGICVFFNCVALLAIGGDMVSIKGLLYFANMLCFAFVAIALTYLISRLTESSQVVSIYANILSLGMSFLCGIFVPKEFLGDGIIRIAHFLPSYWYVLAVDEIDKYNVSHTSTLLTYMLIQLMFGMAIIVVGVYLDKIRKNK